MPFAIGDTEVKMASYGVCVATLAAHRYRCPACKSGELKLLRVVMADQNMLPATFICYECDHTVPPSPDLETGAVYPALVSTSGTRTGRTNAGPPPRDTKPKFTPGGYGGGWQ